MIGLAWTRVGGEILQIECNVMPGKGEFRQTGSLGDVMKESIFTALSYIRSKSQYFQIQETAFTQNDFHVHVPSGAIPKDGPSAGISMCTALVSAITGIPVMQNCAMTGEISLHGRILPIGGVKEKVLAAMRHGIKKVVLPSENKKDVEEMDSELLADLEIVFASNLDQVFEAVLIDYNNFVDKAFKIEANRYYPKVVNQKVAV